MARIKAKEFAFYTFLELTLNWTTLYLQKLENSPHEIRDGQSVYQQVTRVRPQTSDLSESDNGHQIRNDGDGLNDNMSPTDNVVDVCGHDVLR